MNTRILKYYILFFLAMAVAGSYAQDRRTLETKVADILAQLPVSDQVHGDRVMNELTELGPQGFQYLTRKLTPPGTGDDTAVRFAINGMARYSSAFNRENSRSLVENGLIEALENQSDTEVKTFLLNQLNLVGTDKTVKAVKKYLSDEALAEPVAQTLVETGTQAAAKAMYEGLSDTDNKTATILVNSLGVLKCSEAVRTIGKYVDSPDWNLRKAALYALANIGHPDSYPLLLKAAKGAGFKYEPTNAAEAFLIYSNRLGEDGELKLCRKALNTVIKENQSDDRLHNQSVALSIFARYFDYEALPLLLKAYDNSNKEFRCAVLNHAENIGGSAGTRKWIEIAGASGSEKKSEIIDMLGRRGDKLAIGYVTGSLNDPSSEVRAAAITALVKLQEKDAVPALIEQLAKGSDIQAAKAGLLQLLSEKHLSPVAARMKSTSGAVKAAFIEIIAAKSGNNYFDEILTTTSSSNQEEKAAAFRGLKFVAEENNLEALINLLLSVEDEEQVIQVQQAVVAAAKNSETEKTDTGKLLTALKTTGKKERIIAILPEVESDAALKAVSEYFNSSSGQLKESSFKALANWKNYSAAELLYQITEKSSGDYRSGAISNFIRLVGSANLPDDQKLLQYRKIMPYASGTADQKLVVNAIGNLKTFLSLVYLEQYLENTQLEQSAARSIMRIALPDADGKNGFTGQYVRTLLKRVASVISGEESEYDIININNYLGKMPDETGFVSMFNGKNLDGWQGLVENPVARAKMSPQDLARKQEEANAKMVECWAVKDNTIVFNGHGANLCSVKEYGDFEMIVDWRITRNGDSGIYLRGTPQVQIWDTALTNVGAQVGSGGLYNNQKHEKNPLKLADNPVGEWNTFHIQMIGENVTVYLNGELVVDNTPMENFWDRNLPMFDKGPVELQAHGTDLAFRDIYIKEINSKEIGLTDEEISDGFVSLFNGSNLNGWQGNTTDYFARNGELIVQPSRGGHGNLFTEKEYQDFIFRFEFQLTPGANNGLGIRAPLKGDAAYHGLELQILDNSSPIYANLKAYQYHGSVYGIIPAKQGYLNPVGEWNKQEVIVKGTKIKITLNGTVILDGDVAEASKNGTPDGKIHPGLMNEKGHIGFLGHGSELKFRNIRLKELND